LVPFSVLHHLESNEASLPSARLYAEVEEQVRLADLLGFDIAWVAEHHFNGTRGRVPAPLLFLVHLAGQTRRIRLGSAVLPAPFYHPLRLAEDVALADVLMAGRLACGISSSAVPDDMRVFGVSQEGKHERMRETLGWLRRAWSSEAVEVPPSGVSPGSIGTGHGAVGDRGPRGTATGASTADGTAEAPDPAAGQGPVATIVPSPLQRPDDMVWVAASTEGAAQVAGELGFHLLLPSLRPVPSSARHVGVYRAALESAGVDFGTRMVQNTFHLVIDEDHDTAMRLAEPILRAYYEGYVRSGAVGRLEDESTPAVMARINFVAGGPEAVAEQLAKARDALSLTHIAFQSRLNGLTHQQVLRGLELVMSKVAPLLESSMPPMRDHQPV
jgi:alkanesulfonate monooxygenase SsuD/methylene tetrahydromethanopterin reductase-like flavin-dependent oxidoreductase (luciferase family)